MTVYGSIERTFRSHAIRMKKLHRSTWGVTVGLQQWLMNMRMNGDAAFSTMMSAKSKNCMFRMLHSA